MTEVHHNAHVAQTARAKMAERFLAAVQSTPDPVEGPLAFPAYTSLKVAKILLDGTLNITLNVPQAFAAEVFPRLVAFSDRPVTVSLELIPLPEIPDD